MKERTGYFNAIQTTIFTSTTANNIKDQIKTYVHGSPIIVQFGEGGVLVGSIYDYIITDSDNSGFICIK